jgi:hypothetical protein
MFYADWVYPDQPSVYASAELPKTVVGQTVIRAGGRRGAALEDHSFAGAGTGGGGLVGPGVGTPGGMGSSGSGSGGSGSGSGGLTGPGGIGTGGGSGNGPGGGGAPGMGMTNLRNHYGSPAERRLHRPVPHMAVSRC